MGLINSSCLAGEEKPIQANLAVKRVFKDVLEGKVFEAHKLIEAKMLSVK